MFFFFNDTATTEIYTLSLHDALPISGHRGRTHTLSTRHDRRYHGGRRPRRLRSAPAATRPRTDGTGSGRADLTGHTASRSEEHTSELQSRQYLVCRLLLEKKKDDSKF